jgi:hypothetical protein
MSHMLAADFEECGCDSDDEARGWEGHLAQEDDGTVSVAFFCPECVADIGPG